MVGALVRPWCCPDPVGCTPFHQGLMDGMAPVNEPQPGESVVCYGRMSEDRTFTVDGIDHRNDLSLCMIAATKGVIRFLVNEGDLWHFAHNNWEALVKVAPENAESWGAPGAST